jgi:hypothetical protein
MYGRLKNLTPFLTNTKGHPKEKVFCALHCGTVFGPFVFGKGGWGGVVYRIIYPIMFILWLMPQLLEDKPNVVFQHGGAPLLIHP